MYFTSGVTVRPMPKSFMLTCCHSYIYRFL